MHAPPSEASRAPPGTDSVSRFLWQHAHLVQRELAATRARDDVLVQPHPPEELEERGLALLHLSLQRARHTWQGASLAFEPSAASKRRFLPMNTFKKGAICILQDEAPPWADYWSTPTNQDGTKVRAAKPGRRTAWQVWGVVSAIMPFRVEVIARLPHGQAATPESVSKFAASVPASVRLLARADYEVFQIMRQAIEALAVPLNVRLPAGHNKSAESAEQKQRAPPKALPEGSHQPIAAHMRAILCSDEFTPPPEGEEALPPLPFKPLNSGLNEEQCRAIRRSLLHPSLYFVQPASVGGPPSPPPQGMATTVSDDDSSSVASDDSIHTPPAQVRSKPASHPAEDADALASKLSGLNLDQPGDTQTQTVKSLVRPPELIGLEMGKNALPVHLLHGPPGTGKTTTLVELIAQLVLGTRVGNEPVVQDGLTVAYGRRPRILVTAPSNLAIDTVAERLVAHDKPWSRLFKMRGIKVARLGNPVRMTDRVARHMHHFHASSETPASSRAAAPAVSPTEAQTQEPTPAEAQDETSEAHLLEQPVTNTPAAQHWGQAADVVLSTLHASGTWDLSGTFDYIIIDEACQAVEPLCWVPLTRACPDPLGPPVKVVIAGDPHQLGPVLLSVEGAQPAAPYSSGSALSAAPSEDEQKEDGKPVLLPPRTLQESMFERLLAAYRGWRGIKTFLSVQYRFNDEIMAFPNESMYGDGLQAYSANRRICLDDLPNTSQDKSTLGIPLLPSSLSRGPKPESRGASKSKGGAKGKKPGAKPKPKSGGNGKKPMGKKDKEKKAAIKAEKRAKKQEEERALKNAGKKAVKQVMREEEAGSGSESEEEGEDEEDWDAPLVFYDTAGQDLWETQPSSSIWSKSKSNEGEVRLVVAHVLKMLAHGVEPEQISILTPYTAQVRALLEAQVMRRGGSTARLAKFYPGITIGSIDSMQGQENEVVIVSLVRSNRAHEVGFLQDIRRLNVAWTRAKRQLCIVGDSETIGGKHHSLPYLRALVRHLKQHAVLPAVEPLLQHTS